MSQATVLCLAEEGWENETVGDGGEDQEIQGLFSIHSCETERWNRKMKEQPAYASQEQNQHLQSSLPKSHTTCSQPTIDKPYGIFPKGRFSFRWSYSWTGGAGGAGQGRLTVRNNTTASDWTTHLLFSQQSTSLSRYTISGFHLDPLWSEEITVATNTSHPALCVPVTAWNLHLWPCDHVYKCVSALGLGIHCRGSKVLVQNVSMSLHKRR